VSLRLPEPLYLKLKYLSEKTKASQQEIIFELLAPYLEEEVKKY
jgi:predicted DNA-binding protein